MSNKLWRTGASHKIPHSKHQSVTMQDRISKDDGKLGARVHAKGLNVNIPCVYSDWRRLESVVKAIASSWFTEKGKSGDQVITRQMAQELQDAKDWARG